MPPVYYQMDTSRLSNRKSAEIGFCYFVLRKGQEHGESKENGEKKTTRQSRRKLPGDKEIRIR